MRVFCEDGHDFIRSVVRRSSEDPFTAFTGARMSRTKEHEVRRKSKKLGSQTEPRIIAGGSAPETALHALPRNRISAFVMNLPDSAIQFLDAFKGILASDGTHDFRQMYDVMPIVHCYCFTRELEPSKAEADIRNVCALQFSWTYTATSLTEGGSAAWICFNR